MNKLKDIIYDKNDLLIALLILLCAAFVIYGKIDVIMDYPSTLEASALSEAEEEPVQYTGSTDEEEGTASPDSEEQDDETPESEETDAPADTSATETEPSDTEGSTNGSAEKITVTIDYGATGSDIAQILVDAGLLDSRQEFYDAVNKAGADTRLKAGEFNIPMNATPDEIISVITQ